MNKKYNISSKTIDKIAITSSILCAIHCAILPLIITASTWVGFQQLKNPMIEWVFIILGLILFYFSIFRKKKTYKSKNIIIYGIIASSFLIISRFTFVKEVEIYFTLAGTFCLVYVHFKNLNCAYK